MDAQMIMNEKIKASEVQLTGVNGEDLGIVPTREALTMAKQLKVDLVCESLMTSPPPCRLVGRGEAKQQRLQEKRQERKRERPAKLKEIRLTPHIEDHDYDTKRNQSERSLQGGDAVLLVVRIQGKEGAKAKGDAGTAHGRSRPLRAEADRHPAERQAGGGGAGAGLSLGRGPRRT
ncbi:translation initiation factor IF-3 [Paenibacillus sp. P26]|nr:translation initiation factor IF-3 [Paenibacillus sp. P26]